MSGENSIRLNSILLLDVRNEFSLNELQKIVCTATRRSLQLAVCVFGSRLHRRQVTSTIGVSDANHNQFRHTIVSRQELNGARGVADVSVAVSHVEYRVR